MRRGRFSELGESRVRGRDPQGWRVGALHGGNARQAGGLTPSSQHGGTQKIPEVSTVGLGQPPWV